MNDLSATGASADAAWAQLAAARSFAEIREAWLALLVRRVPSATDGLVLDRVGDVAFRVTATSPRRDRHATPLEEIARDAVLAGKGLVAAQPGDMPTGTGYQLAYPIIVDDQVHGAVALTVRTENTTILGETMRHLQWSLAWLRDAIRQARDATGSGHAATPSLALECIADIVGAPDFKEACHTFAMRLASRLGLERVSVGFRRGKTTRLAAISNSSSFGHQFQAIRLLEAAMDEAQDQDRPILNPPGSDDGHCIRRAHEELALQSPGSRQLTIPLTVADETVGALVCETIRGRAFSQADLDALGVIAALSGPMLVMRRDQGRNIIVKNGLALRHLASSILGSAHLRLKLVSLGVVALLASAFLVRIPYEIDTDASVEAAMQRAIVAPYDAFIMEARARAGDEVRQGDVITLLDDHNLRLDELYWQAELNQRQLEYDQALGERRISEMNIAKARIDQAEIRLRSSRANIELARLVAPVDGLVVSGDLSQSIGAPVRRGDVLFTVAPKDSFRLILKVDETQIAQVQEQMTGRFLSTSLNEAPMDFVVTRITPIALAEAGRTVFRVEGDISGDVPALRPGMQGVAKVSAGHAPAGWVWTRSFLDWLRLVLWSWLP